MGAYSSPGQGAKYNLAGEISKTMKGVGTRVTAMAGVKKAESERKRILENTINKDLVSLDKAVYSLPTINDASLSVKLKAKLKEELDRVHELSKSGIKGDNSEYLDARSKFESLVTNVGSYIGTFNEQAKIYKENANNVLNQESNNPWKMEMFNNFLDKDGVDIDFEFIGDDMVWKYDGNVVNASKNIKAIKAGTDGLLTYNIDHSKNISLLFDFVAPKNYKGKSISDTYKNGGTIKGTDVTDWAEQSTKIRKELQDGKALDDYLDQSSYEKYVPDSQNTGGDGILIIEGDDAGNEARKKLLKEKMIDKMMADYGHEKIDPVTGDYVYETETGIRKSVDANYKEEKKVIHTKDQFMQDHVFTLDLSNENSSMVNVEDLLNKKSKKPGVYSVSGGRVIRTVDDREYDNKGEVVSGGVSVEEVNVEKSMTDAEIHNAIAGELGIGSYTAKGEQTAVLDDD